MSPNGGPADNSNGNGKPPRWYALHTRARHEKRVSFRLQKGGFEAFLPLVPRERRWHDRKKVIEWPIFPGYVFVRFSLGVLSRVLGTPGIASVVRFNGEPAAISEEEIDNVRRLAAAIRETGQFPEPTPLVEEGQRVRIVSGALRGVEGVVVERRGGGRVLVQVGLRAIGQGVRVDVDATTLRVLDSRP